jgi:predicted Zn-dependent protease
MNRRILSILLLFFAGVFSSFGQDPVFDVIKNEMNRSFSILKKEAVPVYYIYARIDEMQSLSVMGRLGRLQSPAIVNSPARILSSGLRVGGYESDNSHEIRESDYGSYRDMRVEAQYIPYEDNPRVLKTALWLQLDELYKKDIQLYEQIKANVAVKVEQEDKSADFSKETANEKYYEAPVSWESLHINPQILEEKVRKFSAVFNENKDILDGIAYYSVSSGRKIFVDTEGREIAENDISLQLVLSAEALADDGMYLPLQKSWMAFSLAELPSDEEVVSAAREISQTLSALKKAPAVESFTGPAILSPEAAGVFFHEIFGHRVEGTRLKQENDAQTFKKKVGEQVLPRHLSVTFDPTVKYYQNTPLVGNYIFDDEGIRAQRVEVVKNGILRNFLMNRTPIEGFAHSNGHGRSQVGAAPVARQSNMLIESSQKLSDEELIKRLRKEAKSQKKEYAYYFKEVSGGYTTTSRYSPNAFNVTPLIVYRIYADGRPDELVRGVDLVGTPLAMFSQIEACGRDYKIFNGVCGAESGSVPVSCIAPALFVKQIETQKRAKAQSQPPLLAKPQSSEMNLSGEALIAASIKKELSRSLEGLKIEGLQSPFFISYTLGDMKRLQVSASQGSLVNSAYFPLRTSAARLLIGNYDCTDENFEGSTGGATGFDGSPCLDNDEAGIRYTIWKDLDAIYKNAAETYEQKLSAIKQLNIPAKDLELPDWDKTPQVVMNDLPRRKVDMDKAHFEEYVKAASAVFKDYPGILSSQVSLQISDALIYFYNTEQTEFRYPLTYTYLNAFIQAKTDEGEDLSASFEHTFAHPDELPSVEKIAQECRALAEKMIEKISAPKIEESYAGPVLFEDVAVVSAFYSNFFAGDISLIASRKPLTPTGFSYGGNHLEEMVGKRITAKEITIEDWTGTPEYKGVKLLGYAPVDGQGVVPPARLTLVENGMLKALLNDRVPTPKAPHSTGHALLSSSMGSTVTPGVVRLTDTRTKKSDELKNELLKRAKDEGYEYAYIVRKVNNGGAYPAELFRISVADGSEKQIRSASINDFDAQTFKNIIAVSDNEMIYNTGNQVTVIVPDAILFEELQIRSDRVDNFRKPPLVAPGN